MTSSIRIRRFVWRDLEAYTRLFNAINGITHSEKAFDLEFMRQILRHPSCNPEENCFLAELRDEPVGFALVAPELPIGRAVVSGGVIESHRGQGIGRRLLRQATEYARGLGVKVLHIQAPADSAGPRHMLESDGFNEVKTYWQMRWEGDTPPSLELPAGFCLRAFQLGQDELALTELQNAAFGQHWGFCPNTVEEISARVRFQSCDPEGIVFILENGNIAGYNWTLRASNETRSIGWIAMTGVHSDYRGRGLGRAVVVAGIDYLKSKGVDGVELEVDSENEPATALYRGLGFRQLGQTNWYERRFQ